MHEACSGKLCAKEDWSLEPFINVVLLYERSGWGRKGTGLDEEKWPGSSPGSDLGKKTPQPVGLQFLHLLNSGGRLWELYGFTPFQAPSEWKGTNVFIRDIMKWNVRWPHSYIQQVFLESLVWTCTRYRARGMVVARATPYGVYILKGETDNKEISKIISDC